MIFDHWAGHKVNKPMCFPFFSSHCACIYATPKHTHAYPAAKDSQILERERKAKLQVERQMEERQKKLDEQRRKEEQRRSAVEEKRKQKQEEEKVRVPGVLQHQGGATDTTLVL